ncbi:DUF397 domain-containing protein [Streptomyces sp. NBC_00483]|uniref:DUF397 domain-containing protein n=1 Tax=Streptomyces sp. NBC_00483 TaxID=2975756 RepID=UPI002E18C7CF
MRIKPSTGEVTDGLAWFKSSYSSNEGSECVEVADDTGTVHVHGSKRKLGARLTFGANEWATFVTHVRGQEGLTSTGRTTWAWPLTGAAPTLPCQKRLGGSPSGEAAFFFAAPPFPFLSCSPASTSTL